MRRKIGLIILLIVLASLALTAYKAYTFGTCGRSDEALQTFLKDWNSAEVKLIKVEQTNRIKAVLFEREDVGPCISIFERRLFGLRWKYISMKTMTEQGLHKAGNWSDSFERRGCAVIYGDNRDGNISAYKIDGAEEIARDNLEADYILDIYLLDGYGYENASKVLHGALIWE